MKPGDVVAERFEIDRLVGAGGMGDVYRARDRVSGAPVALKTLHELLPEQIERFHREAEVLSHLHHPGVVRYVAHGHADGQLFLAMEWLEGQDLWQRLSRGPLPMEQALDLVAQAAEALAAAHERGIVHRDIKPGNIFLLDGEVRPSSVKLLDFGIARLASAAAVTRTGLAVGTPAYMAPEQARGSRHIDARADVFSLGCVLYECVTGRVAFAGDHPLAVLGKVLLEPAPRIADVIVTSPAWLDELLSRMLAKDPAGRPSSARQVAAEIARRAVDLSPPSSATRSGTLTASERRLRCVLMAAWPPGAAASGVDTDSGVRAAAPVADPAWAPTLAPVSPRMADEVRATLATWGARLEMLGEGGLVATLAGIGPPTDQTALAARCALALRELSPIDTVAVATGWGITADRAPVGEVIDRAAALLAAAQPAAPDAPVVVRLDEMTEQLLDERFVIVRGPAGAELASVRDDPAHLRTLLGKPSPCVGRETELSVLIGLWRECIDESMAHAVLVTAAAGVGKSRLATELVRTAQQNAPTMTVWSARGDPLSQGSPFALVAAPIRHAAGIAEGDPLEVRRDKLRAAVTSVGETLPRRDAMRVLHFLGELVGTSFEAAVNEARSDEDDSLQIRAARRDPVLMGDQMRRAWEDFARAQADRSPLLLIIEDLHWGDLPSVHLLDGALKTLAQRPFLVVALARPDVLELFPTLWSERALQHIRLNDLTRRASARLVRQVLGPATLEATVKKLVELSGGNAFFLEELIRAEATGVGELPGTVVAMAQARLERLEPEARRLLRAASIFGQAFPAAGVARLLGVAVDLVNDWVRELTHREVIVDKIGSSEGPPQLAFRHALLREAAYEMLPAEDRAVGHRLAAEWLESAGERDAVVLAEHLERAGESGRAATWYLRAAQQALEGADHDATVTRAQRAIACGASGEELGAAHVMQAEAVIWRGDFPEVQRHASVALEHLSPQSPLYFRAIGPLAFAHARLHDHAANLQLAAVLTALPATAQLLAEHAIALARVARELLFARRDAARALARAAELSAALPADDPGVTGWVEHALAVGSYQQGDLVAARDHAQRSVDAFRQSGDLRFVAALSTILASVYLRVGDHRRAAEIYASSAVLSERLQLTHVVASSRSFQARAMLELGAEAEAQAEQLLAGAIATAHAIDDPRTEAGARAFLTRLHLRRGDLASADRESSEAVAARVPHPSIRAYVLDTRARVLLALGRAAEAVPVAREAYQAVVAEGELADHAVAVRVTLAEALRSAAEEGPAQAMIVEARAVVEAAAARIGDEALRESFLERVPANARAMELAQAWASTGEQEDE